MKTHISILNILLALAYICSAARGAEVGSSNFSNNAATTINDIRPVTPFPPTITISGFNAKISDFNVVLTGLSHPFPEDIGTPLAGPGGQKVVWMNDPGGFNPISNINLTIDQASASISDPTDMTSDPLVPGTYKPTNLSPAGIVAGPPRPDGPYSTSLSVFNGTSLNGTRSLFVRDFSASDAGQLASGLGVQGIAPQHGSLLLLGIGLLVVAGWLRRRAR